jgi:hypothetical protein
MTQEIINTPNNGRRTSCAVFCSLSTSEKKRRVIAIIEGWSCDKCTYQHRYPAQICAMCNTNCNDEDKDGNATGAYSSSSSARSATTMALKREWPLADEKDYATKKQPSQVAKKTVSYCDTSDSELEFNEDGYKQSKTKNFKKKANAINSDSDEFELGPETDTSNSDEFELGSEADTVLSEIESEAAIKSSVKSSIGVDERKLATKPYITGAVVELTDKEKRAMNKKIKEEVLQKNSQFKAVLGVTQAFGMEHWKELLSQMMNVGDYTNQLFFGQSRVSRTWRSNTLLNARAKLGIGIIRVKEGGRALGEIPVRLIALLLKLLKESLPHTLFVYLMMLQLIMLQLVK